MTDITLKTIASGYNLQKINDNFQVLKDVVNNEVVHATGGNNVMSQDLDMNSNKILNSPKPVNPNDLVRLQDVVDSSLVADSTFERLSVAATAGQTVLTVSKNFNTAILYRDGVLQFESKGAYSYTAGGNTITLTDPITAGEEVEVWINDLFVANSSSGVIVNLRDYVSDTSDAAAGLTQACLDGYTVDFDGLDITLVDSFVMSPSAKCRRWVLSGGSISTLDGRIDVGSSSYFEIDMMGGYISLGLKQALVTVNSTGGTNIFTVSDSSEFEVGDQISCSFSNSYLPNSESRIVTLGEFNTVLSKTPSTITTKYNVPEVIPANAVLLNGRFDYSGLKYSGSGTFILRGGRVINSRCGYHVTVDDSTRSARFYSMGVDYNDAALDQFSLTLHSAFFEGGSIGRNIDIAKQAIVARHNAEGIISLKGVSVKRYNKDTLFYVDMELGAVGSFYVGGSYIDGYNDKTFSGSAMDHQEQNCLHLISYQGTGTGLDVDMGDFIVENTPILNIRRTIFGTSYATRTTFKYKSFRMSNCNPCDADPLYISVTDAANSSLGPVSIKDSNITVRTTTLNNGVPLDKTGLVVYDNCTLTPDGSIEGISYVNIARSTLRNCELRGGAANEGWKLLGNSSILENTRLPKKSVYTDRLLTFLENYTQLQQTSLILEGLDVRTQGYLTTADWFDAVDGDTPNVKFDFPGVGPSFRYGGSSQSYNIELMASSWDAKPYLTRGWFTLWVPAGSTVEGDDGTRGKVQTAFNTTVAADANAGASSFILTSNPGSAIVSGSMIGFNDVNTPSDYTYWYEVLSVAGTTITIIGTLDIDIKVGDLTRGINVIPTGVQETLTGTANPTVAPQYIGQHFYNTTDRVLFEAIGLTVSDWTAINNIALSGVGDPTSVTPNYITQVYRNTSGNVLWMAYGTSSGNWKQIS